MFRLRSKSGDESVFRTPEEIRAALLSGFVTPDAQIWDAELKGWVPLLEHALYQQIAAAPGGRKSSSVKAPPAGGTPTTAKPVQKLVIRRPGEPAAPTPPPAPKPPAPKPPVVDEGPDLVMLDVDLSMDTEPAAPTPPPAPPAPPKRATPVAPPPAPAPPPKRPTPAPAPPVAAEPAAPPRRSTPQPVFAPRHSTGAMSQMEAMGEPKSKTGLIIAAVVVLAAAGGGFAVLRGKGGETPALPDSTLAAAPIAVVDPTADSTAASPDSARGDSSAVAAAPIDTAKPRALPPAPATDSTTIAAASVPGVSFAPPLERGFTSWNARPATGQALSIPELEAVRLRYVASQARALEQYEAGLEAIGFSDMFDPARIGRQDRRDESLEAVDAGREALQDFRRRQAAIDFAYTDTLRQSLPAGSDAPDLRTFGPILRENAGQVATTDSLLNSLSDIYTLLVNSPGGFTLRGRELFFKDAAKADQYRVLQERLTAQLGRLRNRPVTEIPPAMAAILRGIGLPR